MARHLGRGAHTIAFHRQPRKVYDGGRIEADQIPSARWDSCRPTAICGIGSNHSWLREACSFCSVWPNRWQKPRQRASDGGNQEIVDCARKGFPFHRLADDNF